MWADAGTAATWGRLAGEAARLAAAEPRLARSVAELAAVGCHPGAGLSGLLGRLLRPLWLAPGDAAAIAAEAFAADPGASEAAIADLEAITRLNFEPGGLLGTWIGGRGFHMLAAHRVAHVLWGQGRHALAMAWKTEAALLGADIHPAARLGRRLFLDHGIGVVIGETAVIEDDVCLWHGVTLGSTLMQSGDRHPKIRRGAVLGAGATILGAVEVGAGSVVAGGSVVLADVPPATTVAGNPARVKSTHRHPYGFEVTP